MELRYIKSSIHRYIDFRYIEVRCIDFRYIEVRCMDFRYIEVRCMDFRYIEVRCIDFRYIEVRCIDFRYIEVRYIDFGLGIQHYPTAVYIADGTLVLGRRARGCWLANAVSPHTPHHCLPKGVRWTEKRTEYDISKFDKSNSDMSKSIHRIPIYWDIEFQYIDIQCIDISIET